MVLECEEPHRWDEANNSNSDERTGQQSPSKPEESVTSPAERDGAIIKQEKATSPSIENNKDIETYTEPEISIQMRSAKGGRLTPIGEGVWDLGSQTRLTKFLVDDNLPQATPDGYTESRPVANPSGQVQRRIYLDHDEGLNPSDRYQTRKGSSFIIPWALCQTWKDMKKAIRDTYEDDKESQEKVDEGNFQLMVYNNRVLPQYWSALVEPEMAVRIQLGSQDDDPKSDNETKANAAELSGPVTSEAMRIADETATDAKHSTEVTYRVDCYMKGRYSAEPNKFLRSDYYDNPIAIEFKKGRGEKSVLEVVKTITFGFDENRALLKQGLKEAPKLGKDDAQGETMLHIHSAPLLNALRSIVKYSSNQLRPPIPTHLRIPGDDIEGDADIFKEGIFPYPYLDLFHYKAELVAYKTETTGSRAMHTHSYNEECNHHIDILVRYLYNEPTIQLAAFEDGLKKSTPTVTFAGFRLLVKPGSDVYVSEENQLNVYVVDAVYGGINYMAKSQGAVVPTSYKVHVWNLVFNGKIIKRKSKIVKVTVFDNEHDVLSLPVFPTHFHDNSDHGTRKAQLIARGKQFFKYSKGPAYLEYTGIGLKAGWKSYNRTRVVVEHESRPWLANEFSDRISWCFGCTAEHESVQCAICSSFQGIGSQARSPCCECDLCAETLNPKGEYTPVTFGDYDEIDPKKLEDLSDHQYMVCGSHMFGFVLKDRVYDYIDVSGLDEPRIAIDAIDQLVMRPESNKVTVKAIAKTYTDKDDQNEAFKADLIRGKGEGQIFLLHGPPGTGKTLTAESIAEYTRRPLLSITAADLGHEPEGLEKNLLRFLRNAKAWDGIVLPDEADVYLERRSTNDLMRNSIVSVFLRALEYFQGILFLTTNRVGHFDEAFLSRIHLSIGYDPLDDDARAQIWDGLFRKLSVDHKNGGPEITFEREAKRYVQKDEDVRALNWNGREIRNAFQTAVALAVFEANEAREKGKPKQECIPEITEKHLAQVVRMSTAFKQYIKDTHEGLEDADLAMKLGNRDDRSKVNK